MKQTKKEKEWKREPSYGWIVEAFIILGAVVIITWLVWSM